MCIFLASYNKASYSRHVVCKHLQNNGNFAVLYNRFLGNLEVPEVLEHLDTHPALQEQLHLIKLGHVLSWLSRYILLCKISGFDLDSVLNHMH